MDIERIIKDMTLEEKAKFVSGVDMWTTEAFDHLGIPSVFVSDGPHGLRKQENNKGNEVGITDSIDAVCFPTACATASSFDRNLMRQMGVDLGKECQAVDVSCILGPAINIKRSPLCGRNFEYVSEDPYVAGELSAAYINGVQSQNVGTSLKHFAANNQETERMYASSDMDERTLREMYLTAFEIAVKKSQPWTIMASYNRINGSYSTENKKLLTDILRDEWGFEGLVMSDWGAVSDRVAGLKAGMDLEMPGSRGVNDPYIVESVKNGELAEEDLDKAVRNMLKFIEKFVEHRQEETFDRDVDHDKAVKVEEQCVVLLKNEDKVLPLKSAEKIALIGGFAKTPRYQGGGSSHINAHNVVSALSVKDSYGSISFAEGFPYDADVTDEAMQAEAVSLAESSDKIVVFAGLPDVFESEGYDREHMRLPDCQNLLIDKLIATGKPVIIVLHNGSPVEMPWVDRVSAVVEAYLGGEGVGEAVMNVLYGKVNPSGKLAESFPILLEHNPSYLNFPVARHKVNYAEGVFVGYRYYDTKKMDVLFPFGHGLSYTEFSYSNLKINGVPAGENVQADINSTITVTVDVTNVGDIEGAEIVQLYVSDKTGTINRPVHELKGFDKQVIKPGETVTYTFDLDKRSFAWYSEEVSDWYAADGTYTIEIGKSSRDICLSGDLELTGSFQLKPIIDMDVQLGELIAYKKTSEFIKREFRNATTQFSDIGDSDDPMTVAMLEYMPIRTLRSFGTLTNEQIDELLKELKKLVD